MTGHPLRAVVAFVVALAAVSAGLFALQHALYATSPPLDLTPQAAAPPPVPRVPLVRSASARSGTARGGPRVDPDWLRATAASSGVPEVALDAYARAELRSPEDCGVGWTTLAGIGWVESQHGTLGGRALGADGHSSRLILGPALDGVGPVRAIAASPRSTTFHGDPRWDHAVGPMQFLPTTWETWGADGDGDGARDPNDLDDAALAAADYLCAGGRDLTTASGWTGGVLSYNNARSYLDAVHAAAVTYAGRG